MATNVDPSKIKPVPVQKTLILINNFIVTTSNFMNGFAEVCETKISGISSKITELEVMLAVLEAKLNSIPGLDSANPAPAPAPVEVAAEQLPTVGPTATSEAAAPAAAAAAAGAPAAPSGMVPACEHPDYVPFFKMLKVGVPPHVVQAKLGAAGLNASLVDTPDALISLTGGASAPAPAPAPAPAAAPPAPAAAAAADDSVPAQEHPDYAPFFKMLRVGVPFPVVEGKVSAAGLNAALLSTPEARISRSGGSSAPPAAGGGGGGGAGTNKPLSRRIFDKYDRDSSGDISVNELQAMCLEFGVWLSGDALTIAMRTIDRNGDGQITYEEFVAWYKTSSFQSLSLDDVTLQRRQALAKVFAKYDTDKSGSLSEDEFRGLHAEMVQLGLTKNGLQKVIADIDSDMDGLVQFSELVTWLEREHH